MRISSQDIEQQTFQRKMRGCDREEVASFLRMVAAEVQRLTLEREEAREETARLRSELATTKERERTLELAIAAAERIAEQMRNEGQRDAESLMEEARTRSERLIENAQREVAELEQEITRLRIERDTFENRLRLAIDEHRRLLEYRQERRDRNEHLSLFQRPSRAGAEE